VLIFHRRLELPAFAAFDLLTDEEGTRELKEYYAPYLALARDHGTGFVLEAPTWRASPRWAGELGYSPDQLDQLNRRAIALMEELRDEHEGAVDPIVISGCIGPHDDGYSPSERLGSDAAQEYHSTQIATFAGTAADLVTALTMTYPEEAIGIARAARDHGMPVVIGFTLETDGRLPNGQGLGEAITTVDEATGAGPAYFLVNRAHPRHFEHVLDEAAPWSERIGGLKANASMLSHAELDDAEELDEGDPQDLGARHAELRQKLPRVNVLGGCCGTDHRHVAAICDAWLGSRAA